MPGRHNPSTRGIEDTTEVPNTASIRARGKTQGTEPEKTKQKQKQNAFLIATQWEHPPDSTGYPDLSQKNQPNHGYATTSIKEGPFPCGTKSICLKLRDVLI